MKHMAKRLLSIVLALALVCSLMVAAIATGSNDIGNETEVKSESEVETEKTKLSAEKEFTAENEADEEVTESEKEGEPTDEAEIEIADFEGETEPSSDVDVPDAEETDEDYDITLLDETSDSEDLENVEWITLTNGGELASGYYRLESDVRMTANITIPEDEEVTIDLNGHALTGTGAANSAITNYGTFTLEDSSGDDSGTLTGATNLALSANGGGVYNDGTFTMNGGAICGNRIGSSGGGVYSSGTFTMNGGSISGNTASAGGGGVYSSGTFTMDGGMISNNTANWGGGVYSSGTFAMNGGTISKNRTYLSGGGVFSNGTFAINGGTISGNTASAGGGVYSNGTFTINRGTISGNTASAGGGVRSSGTFTMTGGTISGNTADEGGGVYSFGTFTITCGTISDNAAVNENGGGVYNGGTFTVNSGTISGNAAIKGSGGGVYSSGTFTVNSGTISGNAAVNGSGGGVYSKGAFTMTGGMISDNTAGGTGGGVYKSAISSMYLGGSVVISGNAAVERISGYDENNRWSLYCEYFKDNVYLDLSQADDYPVRSYIQLDGPLTKDASIGVTTSIASSVGNPVQITSAESDTDYYTSSAQYFFSDEGCDVRANTGEHYIEIYGDKPESGDWETEVHNLVITGWEWSEDYSSCIAILACIDENCDFEECWLATVERDGEKGQSCTEPGGYFLIASINVKGETVYSDPVVILYDEKVRGHDYYEWESAEPTCTEAGEVTYTCRRCGDEYTEAFGEALGHDYDEWESAEPTCTEAGEVTYTCRRCGDEYTEAFGEALGHYYDEWVSVEPTCTEAGEMTYNCWRCGDEYTEPIDALGHDWIEKIESADYENDGSITWICSRCGEVAYTDPNNPEGTDEKGTESESVGPGSVGSGDQTDSTKNNSSTGATGKIEYNEDNGKETNAIVVSGSVSANEDEAVNETDSGKESPKTDDTQMPYLMCYCYHKMTKTCSV